MDYLESTYQYDHSICHDVAILQSLARLVVPSANMANQN